MAELSVYYVPDDHERFAGKDREVAESFWKHGVFLVTQDRIIYDRIQQWKAAGRELPPWNHSFTFASMGLGGEMQWDPVPNTIGDLSCPHCGADVSEQAHTIWFDDDDPAKILPERIVKCPSCEANAPSKDLRAEEPFTFARFYLWISDIDEDDWDPSFKATVEHVLGPCREFVVWET